MVYLLPVHFFDGLLGLVTIPVHNECKAWWVASQPHVDNPPILLERPYNFILGRINAKVSYVYA